MTLVGIPAGQFQISQNFEERRGARRKGKCENVFKAVKRPTLEKDNQDPTWFKSWHGESLGIEIGIGKPEKKRV